MLYLTNRDERRFLLRCLKHQESLQVHMRAEELLLPAHACQELGDATDTVDVADNPFVDTSGGAGLTKYIDAVP